MKKNYFKKTFILAFEVIVQLLVHIIFIVIFFPHFRSCQTCRDKITERKRYLSKSREAIFEKVNQSKLKKSLSKSRERLPVCGLTLSKSRDNLGQGLQDSLYPGGQTKVIFLGYQALCTIFTILLTL